MSEAGAVELNPRVRFIIYYVFFDRHCPPYNISGHDFFSEVQRQ
jgi:hypothetical protein